jgi:Flp pilus assembly protein TadG
MLQAKHIFKEDGQSLLEFSVSMVFVLVLLAALVDLGRGLFTYMALRDAAQEGAAYGSINPTATSTIEDRVFGSSTMLQSLRDQFGNNAPIDIQVNLIGSPCTGNGIELVVTYEDFPLSMPFVGAFIGSQTVDITASAANTILSPKCP